MAMTKTLIAAAAGALIAVGAGTAKAALPSYATTIEPPSVGMPSLGSTILTPEGSATITGSMGSSAIATIPGGGTGILFNNGNGTSTLSVPGSVSTTIPSLPAGG
jgi:hypothetical protein